MDRRRARPAGAGRAREPPGGSGAGPTPGREAARLLLPVSCAGCGRWETALCPSCRALLRAPPLAVERAEAAAGLPILALAPYAGPVRAMVLAWKSGRREDLSAVMEEAGAAGGAAWAAALGGSGRETLLASRGLLVVPAPSGAARRLRSPPSPSPRRPFPWPPAGPRRRPVMTPPSRRSPPPPRSATTSPSSPPVARTTACPSTAPAPTAPPSTSAPTPPAPRPT